MEKKIFNKTFVSILLANGTMYLSQRMTTSLVSKYTDYLGGSAAMVGFVMSLFTYTAIIFKVISAPALDSFNRKYILMGAMLTMSVAFFGYGVSNSISVVMIARLIQGAGQAFSATGSLALAADSLPQDKLGQGIGIFSTAQAVSQAIGPSVGLYSVSLFGYQVTFFIGSAMMLFAAVMALRVKLPPREYKKFEIKWENIIAKEAFLPATLVLLLSMGYSAIGSFLIIFAGKQNVESIGLFFTVHALTLLFSRPFVGKMSDKYGLWIVLLPALGFFSISFLIVSISNSLPMFLLAAFISAFGYGACQPAIQTLSMKSVNPNRRGAASSTNYLGTDLGNLIGPVLAGLLVQSFGYSVMWRLMLIPVAIAFVVILLTKSKIEEIENNYV